MKARTFGAVLPLVGVLLLGSLPLGGCGLTEDEYTDGSLEDVLAGRVSNNLQRYRIPAPNIPAARKNTGIVRQGPLFVVIVGPDLHDHVERLGREGIEYGVRLVREPRTHLVLERIWDHGEPIDLFEDDAKLRAEFPQFMGATDVEYAKYRRDVALETLAPRAAALDGLVRERLAVTLGRVEERELPVGLADAIATIDPRLRADAPQFVLTSEGLDWVVVQGDVTTKLMLDFLVSEKRDFKGGLVVRSLFDPRTRETTGLAGTARIRWIDLGGGLVFQAR